MADGGGGCGRRGAASRRWWWWTAVRVDWRAATTPRTASEPCESVHVSSPTDVIRGHRRSLSRHPLLSAAAAEASPVALAALVTGCLLPPAKTAHGWGDID
ncbi:hypothetical protein PR202_ga13782 [Eleusine coracana subsp. coracana]|uniref:Uncharacterized protein n=1 Tax=Eleusine coracana subsp. coracana TaxID=191504 RepID=A0AAV5CEX4_ELECO|nr:hypothetical protein PR202_ga13782 [Eleusine coracana subsp. coracana]